jgi:hypothetical protein
LGESKSISLTLPIKIYNKLVEESSLDETTVQDRIREILSTYTNIPFKPKSKLNRSGKDILTNLYGKTNTKNICDKLNISYWTFRDMAKELGLGPQKDFDEYITQNQLMKLMSISYRRFKIFKDNGLPFKRVNFGSPKSKCYNVIIKIKDLIEWLEKHQDLFIANKIERHGLGVEPEWLKEKRKKEYSG